jgi:DNA polymerase III subunit alpha
MESQAPLKLPRFVHLRAHSAYSLAEGALHIKQMAKLAADAKMPALAITDTGNLFGALEFSEALSEKGIQPIVGCALCIDLQGRSDAKAGAPANHGALPSLAFLAQNEQGYRNLMKLSSRAYLDTPENEPPQIKPEWLRDLHEGLICLSGGPGGPINHSLADGQTPLARRIAEDLLALFGDRFYIELQRHNTEPERLAEAGLIELAYGLGIPLVATNQVYFAKAEDHEAHDALICIAEGQVVAADERRRVSHEHYFKSQAEMAALFADIPEAVENTVEIARRCAFMVKGLKPILPRFSRGDEAEELTREATDGLVARLAGNGFALDFKESDYRERLAFELDVIIKMKYAGYFLIVADFIKWAKGQGIPVGPGRGSGAGSLVAYALTITDLDPLRFALLFERFLNPDRVSMPDFDIDFCQERRDEVINYVQGRYGSDHVAQIITFGKLQARAVCRDVGRVLQMPYPQVDRISKLIPMNPANPVTLSQAIDGEPRIQEERERDPTVKRMLDIGLKLEGLYRHASTHAAGIVIGDRPLQELVPLYRDPRSSLPATQFNMKYVEKAGLVKFDFLGLKTLTVIDKAQKLIRRREPDFDASRIPLDDPQTYKMLSHGDTVGVFQLESSGMRDAVRQMHADRFEDLIALVALYRPGPMANIPTYCARKLGREPIEYMHPKLEPILKETFGVITYQEQVQQIAKDLAGYTPAQADLLRRAMGKKIKSEMDAQRENFLKGATDRGIDRVIAIQIFDACAKFAEYGFNKSHSAPYAYISYQTAYLKARYPVEFLAASMTLDMGNTDKLQQFRDEAKRLGIRILPPTVNVSECDFAVIEGAIAYSLCALKNVGSGAIAYLVDARNASGRFTSLADFARRVHSHHLNKRAVESMAKAGAFDELNPNRAQVFMGVERLIAFSSQAAEQTDQGQASLFGAIASSEDDVTLLPQEPWLPMERLNNEFEAVGFYLSGHPLDAYASQLKSMAIDSWAQFRDKAIAKGATAAKLAGTISYRQERRSKQGNKFAFVGFSDPTGQFEAICFADLLAQARDQLEPGKAVVIRVECEVAGEDIKLRLQGIEPLEKATAGIASGLRIFVKDEKPIASIAKRLEGKGRAPVRMVLMLDSGREVELGLGERFLITPQVKSAIKAIDGVVDVHDL